MAYEEKLAGRVRALLSDRPGYSERKMFGGLCFMIGGNMACGIVKDELMLRLAPDSYAEALSRPQARPMDFTGRPMKGMLYVGPAAIEDDAALADWVKRAAGFAAALPPKSR